MNMKLLLLRTLRVMNGCVMEFKSTKMDVSKVLPIFTRLKEFMVGDAQMKNVILVQLRIFLIILK